MKIVVSAMEPDGTCRWIHGLGGHFPIVNLDTMEFEMDKQTGEER